MLLTSLFFVLTFFDYTSFINGALTVDTNQTDILPPCPAYKPVQNANVTIERNDILPIFEQVAHIHCDNLYDLIGPPKVLCVNGQWEDFPRPRCVRGCDPPPYIKNGGVQIEGDKNVHGLFKNDALATYTCSPGFELSPKESEYRKCDDGVWSGSDGICVSLQKVLNCKPPKPLKNGYILHENVKNVEYYMPGDKLRYDCKGGFEILGPSTQKCMSDGIWNPVNPPTCVRSVELSCIPLPKVPHAVTTLLSSYPIDSLPSRAEVEIRCMNKYHNMKSPCQASTMRCIEGHWIGFTPICVYAKECTPPREIRYGRAFDVGMLRFDLSKPRSYLNNSQVMYQCFSGYEIEGNKIQTCVDGCWLPSKSPVCNLVDETYLDSSGGGQILISLATGTGVLLLLIVICLAIVCRRRKPLSRAVSIQPAVPEPYLSDHPLLHHPDRLALIPFADSLQVGQAVLPTYEEATRDRGPGLSSSRLHRPHWPSLAARRSRNSPNPDNIHVTRQGSLASHSASTRSDPMGSTDTMAVSENSTTVTLDTASSHSGSQPASCRAHCGSLASFDTSSVLNTDGVPLLEESELEEIQGGDAISLAMENRSMTDNGSFKLSTASDLA